MIKGKKYLMLLVLVLIGGLIGGLLLGSSLRLVPSSAENESPAVSDKVTSNPKTHELLKQISEVFEEASSRIKPAVVTIFAEQTVKVENPFGFPEDAFKDFFGEDFLRHFFGVPQEQKRKIRSLGSGVIITKDGYILTNNHVVSGAEKLSVVIGDKKRYEANIVGTDPPTDVAVIKIDGYNLPAASLGNSDEVKVGQWVIAVGNPFQLMHTVTAGIISAKGRSSVGLADYEDFIQTDASINPGNSGGALADLDGNVIGINTAIASPSGGNIGIGFAIPINMAKKVMEQLIAKGKIERGYMGLYLQDIDEDLAKALKLEKTEGVLVADVVPDGPAAKAGIKRGDIIVEIEGQKVENGTQLKNIIATTTPKTGVKIGLLRNGRRMKVEVILEERPEEHGGQGAEEREPQEKVSRKLGLAIQTLTPDIAQQLGYINDRGVIVVDVAPGSPADDAGLQRGDLIKEVNRVKVESVSDFEREAIKLKNGDVAALLVRRGQNTFFAALKVK